MTLSEFSLERPKYESRFGLEMPLIGEVQEKAEDLEMRAEQAATQFEALVQDKAFKYFKPIPEHARRKCENDPNLRQRIEYGYLVLRGIDAVNFLIQTEIEARLEHWRIENPDYAEALKNVPVDPSAPAFTMHPGFSMSGIALCDTYYRATGQPLNDERKFFGETLYAALLVAYMDIKSQNPMNHMWLARNVRTIFREKEKIGTKLMEIHKQLAPQPKV